jgi:hypothetical protein
MNDEHLKAVQELLEMFSDSHSLLQGAAGEDAMSVGDVLKIVRRLRTATELLELCHGTCDLHYGLAFARGTGNYDDPRSVHDEVGDFLKAESLS